MLKETTNREIRALERKIISLIGKIRRNEITKQESGIAKLLNILKKVDEPLYEKYIKEYKSLNENVYTSKNLLTESGIKGLTQKAKDKKRAMIYFHQDLDGVTTAIAMKEIIKQATGITEIDYEQIEYGEKDYALRTQFKDPTTLYVLVDFAKGSGLFDVHTDHHDNQRGVNQDSAKHFAHKKSNVIILNNDVAIRDIFSQKEVDLITKIDSAGFKNITADDIRQFEINLIDRGTKKVIEHYKEKIIFFINKIILSHKGSPGFLKTLVKAANPSFISILNVLKKLLPIYGILNISKGFDQTGKALKARMEQLKLSKEMSDRVLNKFKTNQVEIRQILEVELEEKKQTGAKTFFIDNLIKTFSKIITKEIITFGDLVDLDRILTRTKAAFSKQDYDYTISKLLSALNTGSKMILTKGTSTFTNFYLSTLKSNADEYLKNMQTMYDDPNEKGVKDELGVITIKSRPNMFSKGAYDRYSMFSLKDKNTGQDLKDKVDFIINFWEEIGLIQIAGNPFKEKTHNINLIDVKNEVLEMNKVELLNSPISLYDIKQENELEKSLFKDSIGFTYEELESLFEFKINSIPNDIKEKIKQKSGKDYREFIKKAMNTRLNNLSEYEAIVLKKITLNLYDVSKALSGGHPGIVNITGFRYLADKSYMSKLLKDCQDLLYNKIKDENIN